MIQKLNWEAYTREDRNHVIEQVKSSISSSDGYIMNFNMFSDLALALSIGIECNNIIELHNALSEIMTVSDLDKSTINLKSKKEWCVYLTVSFAQGKGDLVREVPAVPG